MQKISVEDKLPEPNQYVLIHLTISNWRDDDDPSGKRYWRVAKFRTGISEEERRSLPDDNRRKGEYHAGDAHGNNKVPYFWDEFGASSHFGQEVDYWCVLPE